MLFLVINNNFNNQKEILSTMNSTGNKWDHTIPASLIGQFSSNTLPKSRKSKVCYFSNSNDPKGRKGLYLDIAAENIGANYGEYDINVDILERILKFDTTKNILNCFGISEHIDYKKYCVRWLDNQWDVFEPELKYFIDKIRDFVSYIDRETYNRSFIPFVASVFARSIDYREYVEGKIVPFIDRIDSYIKKVCSEAEFSYTQEEKEVLIQFLVQVSRYREWQDYQKYMKLYEIQVLHAQNNEEFILNDLCVAPSPASCDKNKKIELICDSNGNDYTPPSFLIPLTNKAVLKMTPSWELSLGSKVPVYHIDVDQDTVNSVNILLAQSAQHYIVASNENILNKYKDDIGKNSSKIINESALAKIAGGKRLGKFIGENIDRWLGLDGKNFCIVYCIDDTIYKMNTIFSDEYVYIPITVEESGKDLMLGCGRMDRSNRVKSLSLKITFDGMYGCVYDYDKTKAPDVLMEFIDYDDIINLESFE